MNVGKGPQAATQAVLQTQLLHSSTSTVLQASALLCFPTKLNRELSLCEGGSGSSLYIALYRWQGMKLSSNLLCLPRPLPLTEEDTFSLRQKLSTCQWDPSSTVKKHPLQSREGRFGSSTRVSV